MTVSGGEPLIQKDFLISLLRGCQELGINTAIETCGYAPWDAVVDVLPHLDALYYDLKHMDSKVHKQITGVDNLLILTNLLKIDASDISLPITVRVPLIPGLNDTDENIAALGWLCKRLKKLDEVHVLPYHRLGLETYRQLSIDYALEGLAPASDEVVQEKAGILKKMGLKVKIGGR